MSTDVRRMALALALGGVVVALSVPQINWVTTCVTVLSAAAVLLSVRFRTAATVAVCLSASNMAVAAAPAVPAAAAGLCAAGFLLATYAGNPISATLTRTTIIAALSFAVVVTAVAVLPWDWPWSPLIAPFGLLTAFAIVAMTYARRDQNQR